MADHDKKPATYADLEAVPSHLVAEIIDGRLVTRPRALSEEVAVREALKRILTGQSDGYSGAPRPIEPSQPGG